ncbi:unnamed protein product [Owenia fusiformis]|uniref:Luciferin 4-monooxygenase n=1 Tax=Owenia fusiformis TaxID=6347 RepID=A0A8J1U6T9_OWEFU|nr:unnamed protein product [Owenia fusiformis]
MIKIQFPRMADTNNIVKCPYPDVTIPENQSLVERVFQRVKEFPEHIALVDGISGTKYTYNELVEAIQRVGSGLTKLGFKKKDVLCLYSPNCPEWVITYFAVIAIGGIATTANPLYTAGEIQHQMEDAGATYIATVAEFLPKVQEAATKYTELKKVIVFGNGNTQGSISFNLLMEDKGDAFKAAKVNAKEDIAALPYSSGTTGLPKGVMLTHFNLVANIQQFCSPYFLSSHIGDCYIAVLPFYHIYGQINVLAGGLCDGATIVTMPRFEPELYLHAIQQYKATRLFVVPPMALFLAKDPRMDKYELSSVKEIFCGAAPLSKELQEEVTARLKCKLRQGYGMTELSPTSHISPKIGWKYGAAGICVPNTESKVIDLDTGVALGPHMDGEVCVRGPQVMKGYLNNYEATANTIDEEGWLHTGDIGHYDHNGHFYVVDRLKELVKYKGFQVAPAELEGLLLTHPDIADSAVIGVPDIVAGELPKAFIVKKPGATITGEQICKFVEGLVAPHKKLRGGVEFCQEIPKSPSGKILRRILRQIIKDRLKSKL